MRAVPGGFGTNAGSHPGLEPRIRRLAFARFGGFLHLPFFGYDCDVQQAERQNHHHQYQCHGVNLTVSFRVAKITVVPGE